MQNEGPPVTFIFCELDNLKLLKTDWKLHSPKHGLRILFGLSI
jgi:hypothetical protein